MSDFGVIATGFRAKRLPDVQQALEESLRSKLSAGLTLLPQSVLGQIVGVVADAVSEPWAVGEALWAAFDEAAATGEALDNIAQITGTDRLQATSSTSVLILTGDNGTTVTAGKVVSVEGAGTRFALDADITLATATAWASSTTYAVDAMVSKASNIYRVISITTGISGGTGPTGTGSSIVDGGVTWRWVGQGSALAVGAVTAEETGPKPAIAYALNVIETAVSGWRGAANPDDAGLGRDIETDESLRIRRRQELRGLGNASLPSIQARILDQDLCPGTTSCTIFENETDATDGDGVPPHAFEALVEGGEDQDIREVIWASKAAGIGTHGTETGTVTDGSGTVHTVKFSRATSLTVYAGGTVKVKPSVATVSDAELKEQVATAIVNSCNPVLEVGIDVILKKVEGAITSLYYVHDVQSIVIGLTSGSMSAANITVTTRQRASMDTARIVPYLTIVRLTQDQL